MILSLRSDLVKVTFVRAESLQNTAVGGVGTDRVPMRLYPALSVGGLINADALPARQMQLSPETMLGNVRPG